MTMDNDRKVKCKYCGKEVHRINLKDHEDDCSKKPKIGILDRLIKKGITGWLFVFIVTLIINILFSIFSGYLLDFLLCSISLILFLVTRKKFAVTFTICWLSIGIVIKIIYFIILTLNTAMEPMGTNIIPAIIWTIYLLESKQVKRIYVK